MDKFHAQALQSAVVTLVKTPVTYNRNPVAVSSIKSDVCGADSTAQEGGVENIWQDAWDRFVPFLQLPPDLYWAGIFLTQLGGFKFV